MEIDVISEELGGITGFDAHSLIPAFFESGRFTHGSIQYLMAVLTQLPPQPVAASAMRQHVRNGKPGTAIVGSHVKRPRHN